MPIAKYDEIRKLILEHDSRRSVDGLIPESEARNLREALASYFGGRESDQCVLGIDIYRYSDMISEAQRLVPTLFREIYNVAVGLCSKGEPFLFQNVQLEERFVSTGDGGFQVLPTPFHAVVFATFFELALASYNGSYVRPKLRRIVGAVSVRYAITFGPLIRQDDNFFGQAIIRNARMLSRDQLNRCLLDHVSVEWLQSNLVSVESLLALRADDLHRIPAFRGYSHDIKRSLLFGSTTGEEIRAVHLQKIGVVSSKRTDLDIYSLMLQVMVSRKNLDDQPEGAIVVTVGNLNAAGISP
jgi:hypothetical protein